MKCPECIKEGKTSCVYPGVSMSTLVYSPSYYDEQGNYVQTPDPNTHTTEYTCSNGHKFVTENGKIRFQPNVKEEA